MQRAPIEIAAAEIERLELWGGKLENLLAKLQHRAPIAIWRGSYIKDHPTHPGEKLVILYELDDDGNEVGEELARGSSLEEAIGRL